jgi:hypothetical protein
MVPSGPISAVMVSGRWVRLDHAQGKTLGRPRSDKATEAAIRCALQNGDSGMHKIAAAFGVGAGTVQRIKAEMSTPA